MSEKKAVIFCSASYDIDPKYNQAAREVVRAACLRGYTIVSGGTVKGTMGVVSDAVIEFGGKHRGIIPKFMADVVYPHLDELIWTETMSERKEAMREGTCLAIALPGGIGTLDELMETFTLLKLNLYQGRIIIYNFEGFYNPLKALLDHYVKAKMLDGATMSKVFFPGTMQELEELL